MIASKQNKQIEQAKKLLDKKGRKETGEFLIEGQKLVSDAFLHKIDISKVFVTEEKEREFRKYADKCDIVIVSEDIIKVLCDTKTHQGVVAVGKIPPSRLFDRSSCLVLDRIQDPKNLGSLLRTAMATDIRTVFLIDCVDAFSPKALRSGMSGQFVLNLVETTEMEVAEQTKDLQVICSDMRGENVFRFESADDIALVLGNEGSGISNELKSRCKHVV
jgi:TrmH family RNA methyltransferase